MLEPFSSKKKVDAELTTLVPGLFSSFQCDDDDDVRIVMMLMMAMVS
jgi:hypothetical protein